MISNNFMLGTSIFVLAFIFASFLEYWLHRLMHISPWFGNKINSEEELNQPKRGRLQIKWW